MSWDGFILEGKTAAEQAQPGSEEGVESPDPWVLGAFGCSSGQFVSTSVCPSALRAGSPALLWTLARCPPACTDSWQLENCALSLGKKEAGERASSCTFSW